MDSSSKLGADDVDISATDIDGKSASSTQPGSSFFRPILSLGQSDRPRRRAGQQRQSSFTTKGVKVEWRQPIGIRPLVG